MKILWIQFECYSMSSPPLRPFTPGRRGWRSREAHHRLPSSALPLHPILPPPLVPYTGANHRNVSRCQEAVKCWRGGQRAFTHMWLYFHNSIFLFLLFCFIWSFSFFLFFFFFTLSYFLQPAMLSRRLMLLDINNEGTAEAGVLHLESEHQTCFLKWIEDVLLGSRLTVKIDYHLYWQHWLFSSPENIGHLLLKKKLLYSPRWKTALKFQTVQKKSEWEHLKNDLYSHYVFFSIWKHAGDFFSFFF